MSRIADNFDARTLPIIGNDIAQTGQVMKILSQGCGPDPWITVQAFFTYAPTLAWSLFKPDPLDMAYDRAGRPHHRVRKRKFNLAGVMQLEAPTQPGIRKATFNLAQLGQRIGWYLIILDATTDFLVNWTSMAYQWSGCTSPTNGQASLTGAYGLLGGAAGPTSLAWHGTEWDYSHPGYATNSAVQIGQFGPKTVNAVLKPRMEPAYGHPGTLERVECLRIVNGKTERRWDVSPDLPDDPLSTYTMSDALWGTDWPPTAWQWRVHIGGGACYADGCAISATGAPPTGLLHDP